MRRIPFAAVALPLIALGLSSCGDDDGAAGASGRPDVVVTTNVLGDVVADLVGDQAAVEVIMPPGTAPHEFEASPRQVAAMRDADALVTNGAGLEEGLTEAIEAADQDGVPTVAAIDAVDTLELEGDGGTDPHFFTDPARMATAAGGIADFLAEEVPALDTPAFARQSRATIDDLHALDREVEHTLSVVPPDRRTLVTNHEVFGYFADRYGFDVVGAGDALAHGVVPGLALAVLWGFSPTLGALVAALLMSGAVTLVSHRTRVREDTGIGLLFVGMLALGVVIISRSESFATDVTSLLFGDVLGVTPGDLRGQAVAAAVVVAASVALYRPLMALAFNADKAATLGMHPVATHAALMVLLAVSIVASFDAIGTLLVFGLLIGPPATAGLLVRRVPRIMLTAVALGALAVVLGLAISFHYGTAGGATIAGLAVGQFFVVLAFQEARRALRQRARRLAT